MVLVVKDWPSFKAYIEKWGYLTELVYRVDPVHAEKRMRVRVLGGRYGLDMVVEKGEPTREEIQAFLESRDAKRVEEVKEVEAFFTKSSFSSWRSPVRSSPHPRVSPAAA